MGNDLFFADVKCPNCKKESTIEFHTSVLGSCMKEFKIGDKLVVPDLDLYYGFVKNVHANCPNCECHLVGEAQITEGKYASMRNVKIREIRV